MVWKITAGIPVIFVGFVAPLLNMTVGNAAVIHPPAGGWVSHAPDNYSGSDELNSVSCSSSTSCVAVGTYTNGNDSANTSGGVSQTLVEMYDGSSWSYIASPNQGVADNFLRSVSCTSVNSCIAVGYYVNTSGFDQTLAETWDGSSWNLALPSNPNSSNTNVLFHVSCASSTFCVATGEYYNSSSILVTLAETWNGSGWTTNLPQNPSTYSNYLFAISCPSTTSCIAVGSYCASSCGISGEVDQTLIEVLSSGTWSVTSSPNQGTADNSLRGISCYSSTSCTAVGLYVDSSNNAQVLVETLSSGVWTISTTSTGPSTTTNYLYDISCSSVTSCVAVGGELTNGYYQTLIEVLSSGTWTVATSYASSAGDNFLEGVSCLASLPCVAVGYYPGVYGQSPLIETLSGSTWSQTTAAYVGLIGSNVIQGISCASSTSCIAVGYYYSIGSNANPNVYQTLIETYSSGNWVLSPSPNQGVGNNFLNSVACTSSTSCIAVGTYCLASCGTTSEVDQTLIETLSSGTWSLTASPDQGTNLNNFLNGVSCSSSTSCVAVGYFVNSSSVNQTLLETLNSGSWSITIFANQDVGTGNNILSGISCTAAPSCVAVGDFLNGSAMQTLIESLNAGVWSQTSSADQGTNLDNYLNGVTCTSSSACTAVGYYINSSNIDQTLVESLVSGTWTLSTSANDNANNNILTSVTCTPTIPCIGVGSYMNSSGFFQTLIETLIGNTWTLTTSTNTSSLANNQLNSVSCFSLLCVTAGLYDSTTGQSNTYSEVNTFVSTTTSLSSSANPATAGQSITLSATMSPSTVTGVVNFEVNGTTIVNCGSQPVSTGVATCVTSFNASSTSYTLAALYSGDTSHAMSSGNLSQTVNQIATSITLTSSNNPNISGNSVTLTANVSPSAATGTVNFESNGATIAGCGTQTLTSGVTTCVTSIFVSSGTPYTLTAIYSGDSNYIGSTSGTLGQEVVGAYTPPATSTAWSAIVSQDTLSPYANAEMTGVSCPTASLCWAVGDVLDQTTGLHSPFVEEWNGISWQTPTVLSSTYQTSSSAPLESISCPASNMCIVAGVQGNAGSYTTFVDQYNGTAWNPVTTANPSTGNNIFSGVSCVSATSCVAVGSQFDTVNSFYQTLAEAFSGTSFTTVTSANETNAGSETNDAFTNISIVDGSPNNDTFLAGGEYVNSGMTFNEPMAELYNGTSWSLTSLPPVPSAATGNLLGIQSTLSGTYCLSPLDCYGVGYYVTTGNVEQTLVEQWNGSAWTQETTPDVGTGNTTLAGITCLNAGTCWAVGAYTNASAVSQPLVLEFDGSSWSQVGAADPSTSTGASLEAVTCVSGNTPCTAVGVTGDPSPLVLQYVTINAQLTVESGPLSFVSTPQPITFPAIQLTGGTPTTATTEPLDILDATGSGNGWNITLTSTTFTSGAHTLPAPEILLAPTVSCDNGSGCTLPTNSVTYAYTVPSGATAPTATEMYNAAANTGMGQMTVVPTFTLAIPPTSYSGTYTSTWIFSLISGP